MRDEIMSWMSSLRKCGAATDWAVVIVEPADTKKANKLLPRTSVLDKLKTDVGGKQPERCMSLIGEQRSAVAERCILEMICILILIQSSARSCSVRFSPVMYYPVRLDCT